jgi:hypothetical protein
MNKIIKPNPISFSSLFIEAFFGDNKIGIATGFLWSDNEENFLITNWHVVTGLNPGDQQPIDKYGSTPDKLRVWFRLKDNLVILEPYDIPLFNNQNQPLWKEHKDFQSIVDVAAININLPNQFKAYPINKIQFGDFRPEIGLDVFIAGFPRGISGGINFPIWKRGSIASEPDIDLDSLPKLLIDSMTREGMSGSPVIAQYTGIYAEDPENLNDNDWIGTQRKLLGIYSGRLPGQDEFEAHLGIVWKSSVIESIVQSGIHPK